MREMNIRDRVLWFVALKIMSLYFAYCHLEMDDGGVLIAITLCNADVKAVPDDIEAPVTPGPHFI